MYKNILFRADSSSMIGTGHIMRDLVLASQYKGESIIFATQDLGNNINYKIKESGYKVILLKSNDSKEIIDLVNQYDTDLLIIDHYDIDYKYEKTLKKNTKVKILSFDDTYEKHYCDILLNHNIFANKKKYKGLIPEDCELRCGSKHTLLREEFYKEKSKKRNEEKSKIKKIFISMGGADHSNINIDILEVISKFKKVKVNLLTTQANKNLKTLKQYCENKNWISLHVDSNKVANLMKESDFAIITPSVIANEAYFMELPFMTIKTAENQTNMHKYLKKNNFFTLDKFKKNEVYEHIEKLIGK